MEVSTSSISSTLLSFFVFEKLTFISSPGSVSFIIFIISSVTTFSSTFLATSNVSFLLIKFKFDFSTFSSLDTLFPISSLQLAQFNPPNIISTFLLFVFSFFNTFISRPGSVSFIIFITFSTTKPSSAFLLISIVSFLFIKFKLQEFISSNFDTLSLITSAQCAQFKPPSIISFLFIL